LSVKNTRKMLLTIHAMLRARQNKFAKRTRGREPLAEAVDGPGFVGPDSGRTASLGRSSACVLLQVRTAPAAYSCAALKTQPDFGDQGSYIDRLTAMCRVSDPEIDCCNRSFRSHTHFIANEPVKRFASSPRRLYSCDQAGCGLDENQSCGAQRRFGFTFLLLERPRPVSLKYEELHSSNSGHKDDGLGFAVLSIRVQDLSQCRAPGVGFHGR